MGAIITDIYQLEERHSDGSFRYFFVSEGLQDIVKAIEYKLVGQGPFPESHPLYQRDIFNLGFGDYNFDEDKILDLEVSNNGDHYKVFNTVLSTIPGFFASNHGKALMVFGSDSKPEFLDLCRKTCRKKCAEECRKLHQRIGLYQNYVKKHYDALNADYQFFGGIQNKENGIIVVEYDTNQTYDSVFLYKK